MKKYLSLFFITINLLLYASEDKNLNYDSSLLKWYPDFETALCNGVVNFEGEYLYWKANAPIVYSIKTPFNNDIIPPFAIIAEFQNKTVKMDFHSGYRLKFGMYLPCEWQASVNWTQYFGDGNDFSTSDGQSSDFITFFPIWASIFPSRTETEPASDITAYQRIRLKLLDFVLYKNLFMESRFHLRPFFGVRVAWIYNDMRMLYRVLDPALGVFLFNHMDLNNRFRSAGLVTGFNTSLLIWKGLEFYNDLTLSGLYGKFDLRNKQSALVTDLVTVASPVIPAVITDHSNVNESKLMLQYATGFNWGKRICRCKYYVGISAGYEIGILPKQIQLRKTDNFFSSGTAAPTLLDVSYHGLSASAKLDF